MSLYDNVIARLEEERISTDLYRFQGPNNFEHFDIKSSTFLDDHRDSYVYLSKSLDHHKYFAMKKIRELINSDVLKNRDLQVDNNYLRDNASYSTIKNLVLNSNKLQSLYSIRLICNRSLSLLMNENSFFTWEKITKKQLEKVDEKIYGGGFGVVSEWKDLLLSLIYFYGYYEIDKNAIITLLSNMETSGRVSRTDNIDFILGNPYCYRFELSPKIQSNFTKYEIMDALETIYEDGSYSPNSSLAKNPSRTIKRIIKDYEKGKEKVLTLIDKHYKKSINKL